MSSPLQRRNLDARAIGRAGLQAASYWLYSALVHLLSLTLLTSALSFSHSRFQDIVEAYVAVEITLVGLAAALYVQLHFWLRPLTQIAWGEIASGARLQSRLLPGIGTGAVLALALTGAFLLGGQYEYLGVSFASTDAPLALLSVAVRAAALGAMIWAEEYIFRARILRALRQAMPDLAAIGVTALLYCATKAIQFDLGWMQLLTLGLLALALGARATSEGDYLRPAGLAIGLTVVVHAGLSLPLLGNEFQGILTVRSLDTGATPGMSTARFLTGGIGGPLSSFGLQLLCVLDVTRTLWRSRRLWTRPRAQG